jgi:hypothetical protein
MASNDMERLLLVVSWKKAAGTCFVSCVVSSNSASPCLTVKWNSMQRVPSRYYKRVMVV